MATCRLLLPPSSSPLLLHHRQPNAPLPSSSSSSSSPSSIPRRYDVVASAQPSSRGSSGSIIRVVITEARSAMGRAAIAAVSKARGMAVAGAVDLSSRGGEDAGELAGLDEPLEVPVLNDLVLVLGSLSQSTTSGVMVDFSSDSARVEENVRQATAFGLKSVVAFGGSGNGSGTSSGISGIGDVGSGISGIGDVGLDLEEVVGSLSTFCEKASTGCIVCPTLSIGRILLQQAATAAAFHYNSLNILESCDPENLDNSASEITASGPSSEAVSLAMSLSGFGRVYNKGKGKGAEEEDGEPGGGGICCGGGWGASTDEGDGGAGAFQHGGEAFRAGGGVIAAARDRERVCVDAGASVGYPPSGQAQVSHLWVGENLVTRSAGRTVDFGRPTILGKN